MKNEDYTTYKFSRLETLFIHLIIFYKTFWQPKYLKWSKVAALIHGGCGTRPIWPSYCFSCNWSANKSPQWVIEAYNVFEQVNSWHPKLSSPMSPSNGGRSLESVSCIHPSVAIPPKWLVGFSSNYTSISGMVWGCTSFWHFDSLFYLTYPDMLGDIIFPIL